MSKHCLRSLFAKKEQKAPKTAQIEAHQRSTTTTTVTEVKRVALDQAVIAAIEVDREIVIGEHALIL